MPLMLREYRSRIDRPPDIRTGAIPRNKIYECVTEVDGSQRPGRPESKPRHRNRRCIRVSDQANPMATEFICTLVHWVESDLVPTNDGPRVTVDGAFA